MKFHTVNKAMYQSLNLKIENILYSESSLSPILFPHLFFLPTIFPFSHITNSVDMNMSKLQETAKDRETWCAALHGVAKS